MGQDGIFLTEVKKEIADALDGTRIDKIFQPSRDEIVILFRASGVAKKLLLSVRPSSKVRPKIRLSRRCSACC